MADFYTTSRKLLELVASEFSIKTPSEKSEVINGQRKFHLSNILEDKILEYLDKLESEKKLDGVYYLIADNELGLNIRLRTTDGEIKNY